MLAAVFDAFISIYRRRSVDLAMPHMAPATVLVPAPELEALAETVTAGKQAAEPVAKKAAAKKAPAKKAPAKKAAAKKAPAKKAPAKKGKKRA